MDKVKYEIRCDCNNLFFIVSEGILQIKCRKCKEIVNYELTKLQRIKQVLEQGE